MRSLWLVAMLVPLAGCLGDEPTTDSAVDPVLAELGAKHHATVADEVSVLQAGVDDVFLLAAEASTDGAITSFQWHVPKGALRGDDYVDVGIVPMAETEGIEQWSAYFVQDGELLGLMFGGQMTVDGTLMMAGEAAEVVDASWAGLYEAEEEEILHVVVAVRGSIQGPVPMALVVLEDDFSGPRTADAVEKAIDDAAAFVLGATARGSGVSNALAMELWFAPYGSLRVMHGDLAWVDAGVGAEGARPRQDLEVRAGMDGDAGFTFAAALYDSAGDAGQWTGSVTARDHAWNGDGFIAAAGAVPGAAGMLTGRPDFLALGDGSGGSGVDLHLDTAGGGAEHRFVGLIHLGLGATLEELTGEVVDGEMYAADGMVNTWDGKVWQTRLGPSLRIATAL